MPELPDIEAYLTGLRSHVVGHPLEKIRVLSPFVLRSFSPRAAELEGRQVEGVRRIGKRVVLELEDSHFVVIHLMVSGRLRWKERGVKLTRKTGLAAFDFPHGSIAFTEVSKKKRASIHFVVGEEALAEHDPGGIEPLEIDLDTFREALTRENHTLKRTLTDPRVFSGIGNAYSDEILWEAQLSPVKWTKRLQDDEVERLFASTQATLRLWTQRLQEALQGGFPDKVTAFVPEMAVHGKYKEPCPRCGAPVQRIRRADNEVNYCPTCQTDGKLLADRGLSRLLKGDWPKTLDELDELKRSRSQEPLPRGAERAAPSKKLQSSSKKQVRVRKASSAAASPQTATSETPGPSPKRATPTSETEATKGRSRKRTSTAKRPPRGASDAKPTKTASASEAKPAKTRKSTKT